MQIQTFMTAAASIGIAIALAGCATEHSDPNTDEQALVPKELLASLKLSDTHIVEFWEHEGGDFSIAEELDVDEDLTEGRPRLAEMAPGELGLLGTYMHLAGKRAHAETIEKLRAVDRWLVDNPPIINEKIQSPEATFEFGDRAPMPALQQTEPGDSNVGLTAQEVACREPSWNWSGDVAWFKNNYCGYNSRQCSTEVRWAQYGWYRGPKWFKSTGFAQSHCSSARYQFKRKNYGGFPHYGISIHNLVDTYLSPRKLRTEHWTTTGDRAWFTRIESVNPSNRSALTVHH